jgi:hypothetical protein
VLASSLFWCRSNQDNFDCPTFLWITMLLFKNYPQGCSFW